MRRMAVLAIVLALPGWAGAQPTPAVDEIIVRARRLPAAEEEAPTAFVTTIDPAEHAEQLESVTDALAESVGVQVRRFGGLGAFSTISIRGSSANQVQVYFDGIPLSRARNETVNLADLPLDSLDRIDVYRGTVPLRFGAAGIGGVVNLVPKAASDEALTEVSASYGSFDTRKLVGSHSRRMAGLGLLAHVTYLGSESDFEFFNREDVADADSPHQKRANNSFDSVASLWRADYDLGPTTRIDLTSEIFFKEQGVPGPGARQLQEPSFSEVRSTSFLRLRQDDLAGGRVDAAAAVFGSFLNERFQDPDGDFGAGRQDRDDVTTQIGGNLDLTWRAPLGQELGWFAECSGESFNGFNQARRPENRADPEQSRRRVAVGLQDQIRWFDDLITLVPTLRYESIDDQGTELGRTGQPLGPVDQQRGLFNPGVGAQIAPLPWLELRGNIARLQRAPSLIERFGNRGSIAGNPDLEPEKGITRDIGLRLYRPLEWLPELRLEYAYFNNDIDDIIVIQAVAGPQPVRAANLQAARLRGHELSFHLAARDWLTIDLNYTHQDAEDRGRRDTGNQLPFRPRDELYSRVQAERDWWRTYLEINYVGESFLSPDNSERPDRRVGSRTIFTAGFKVEATSWLSFGLEARNLGNDAANDVANYPLPGRSFFGTLTATLG